MYIFGRHIPIPVLVLLVAAAIIGYRAGHSGSSGAASERTLTTTTSSVVLSYPSSWQWTTAPVMIPGLKLAGATGLAPGGKGADAGLLVGTLPRGESGPLPAAFVAQMAQLPAIQIVNIQEAQAYRYVWSSFAGFAEQLTVFVIPKPGGVATVLACYASPSSSAYLQTCQHIVATLNLVGQAQAYYLTPEPAYAAKLAAAIAGLDRRRAALRQEAAFGASRATLQRVASSLSASFARTAAKLSALQPTVVTGQAQVALTASILRARDAYSALAAAAAANDSGLLEATRAQVYGAEHGVNTALDNFALLGYDQSS